MSSFFICSIACIVRPAFSGSGSLMYSESCRGHDLPRDAEPVLEPAALLRLGRAALAESAPSSGRPPPASSQSTTNETAGVNAVLGSAVERREALAGERELDDERRCRPAAG